MIGPIIFEIDTMAEYHRIVQLVMDNGEKRSPRGLVTRDVGHTTIVLNNIANALPIGLGRKLNPAIGAVEAIQLIAGRPDPELVVKVAPQFKQYLDGGTFHGSYGKRIKRQMQTVTRRLKNDPNTRQAVVTLWDPEIDAFDGMRDYPCTIALGFSISMDGLLEMNVLMRSNDVWRGLAYDVFQFTQLQWTLARILGVVAGTYRHTTWSLHLYETDLKAAEGVMNQPRDVYDSTWQPSGIGEPGSTMMHAMNRASAIMRGNEPHDITDSERWYLEQLHPKADLG